MLFLSRKITSDISRSIIYKYYRAKNKDNFYGRYVNGNSMTENRNI